MELIQGLRSQPMRPTQWLVVLLCLLIAVIDGYEVLIMGFVAPTLAEEWSLSKVSIGYVLSAGLIGMALGAMLFGPLADRIGRRRHILACLTLGALGMLLTGLAYDMTSLIVARVFAGLWIGAIVPTFNTLVAEYSSDRLRGRVMGLLGIGIPLGGVLGGLATGTLIELWGGWQGPFILTGIAALVVALIAYILLPESATFLVQRRSAGALPAYNRIAARMGYEQVQQLPAAPNHMTAQRPLRTIGTGILLTRTILLWSAFCLTVAVLYFANLWTPSLIATATGDAADGRLVGVLVSVGGIVGTLAFAALAARWNPRLLTAGLAIVALPIYLLFSVVYTSVAGMTVAVLVGFVTIGAMQALYAIAPYVYPAAIRGSALGFMTALGRGVSVLIPILLGYWFAAGRSPQLTFQIFGVVVAVVALLVFALHRTYRGRTEDPELIFENEAAAEVPPDRSDLAAGKA